MVVKTGRYGRFLACSGYPDCKNVKPYFLGIKCPEDDCGGALVEKQSRKGKVFFGCNNYPSCKFASWDRPVDRKCDHCDAALLYEKSSRSGSANLYCRICNTQQENEPEIAKTTRRPTRTTRTKTPRRPKRFLTPPRPKRIAERLVLWPHYQKNPCTAGRVSKRA